MADDPSDGTAPGAGGPGPARRTKRRTAAPPTAKKAARKTPRQVKQAADGARRVKPADRTKRVAPVTDGRRSAPKAEPAPPAAHDGLGKPIEELLKLVGEFASHLIGSDADEKATEAVEFLRRRLTGEYEVDPFGFDEHLTDGVLLPVLRPLYRRWFRVDVRGVENVPADGAAMIVANHSGTIALDSLMVQVAVHDEHPAHRHLRMLGADLVFQLPFVADIARKNGTTLACNEDTERLLAAGELVGVWPEGFKGIGKPFSERYKLQRFGRGGFVSAAIRAKAPIVPCAIVGAEETYPMLGNLATLARMVGLPYIPITPTFPWLGPLGMVPLPSKWIIEFGEPVTTDGYGAGAAEDPMLVFELTDRIRETIQQSLYALLVRRRSAFF